MLNLIKSFQILLKEFNYIILLLIFSFIIFLINLWLPNKELYKLIITSDNFDLLVRFKLFISTFGLINSSFTLASKSIVIILSILGGINISMFIFYLKTRITLEKSSGLGLLGIISGLLGVGCASCGSVVLSTLIGVSLTTGIVDFLPLNGLEFGILGMIIVILSIYLLSKKILNPLICKVK